jgi:hypothetical protein
MRITERSNRRPGLRGLIATISLALLICAATALGASSTRTTVSVPSGSAGKATAECAAGRTPVAGGFAAPGFSAGDDGGGVVRLTSRVAGKRSVETKGFNFSRNPADLVSLAYCVKHAPGFQVRRNKVFVPPNSPVSAVASCRQGSRVVGGGFATPSFSGASGPGVITLTSKRANLHDWRVEALNIGGDGNGESRPGTLVAYAYCVTKAPRLTTVSKRAELTPGSLQTTRIACPNGSSAYSGGFDGNLKLTTESSAAGALTSKRVDGGRAWRVRSLDISDTASSHVTVYAYCRGAG